MLDRHSPWDQPCEAAQDTVSAGVHPGDRFEFWHEVARRDQLAGRLENGICDIRLGVHYVRWARYGSENG
jgi:hypothetical protein